MDHFASQPDEGYSEDPLNPLYNVSTKLRNDLRVGADFPIWLTRQIDNLSVSDKTELAMTLLNDLPTSVISQIVQQLNPRLYIDFVRYLPPEICLKILGYLDPVSLISVARSCRAWYELALDRKLWEQLYFMEGWQARMEQVREMEATVNARGRAPTNMELERIGQADEDGHVHKKRAISMSPRLDLDLDQDMVMVDAGATLKTEPSLMDANESSIFGGPAGGSSTGVSQQMSDLDMQSFGSAPDLKGKGVDKGKGRAISPEETDYSSLLRDATKPRSLPKTNLWMRDGKNNALKINWKHLYAMRRRLESNWELGKFVNFQLPHAQHPEEGHSECIYSLQYNSEYLVSGSRDRTLKIWNMQTRRLIWTLAKHKASVLCLQFDSDPEEDIIVSGSSDSDVIVWKFSTGEVLQVLTHAHRESVLNVKFDKKILVTCSKDKTIKIFNRKPLKYGEPGYQEIDPVPRNVRYGYGLNLTPDDLPVTPAWTMIASLEGHNAAVNAVQIHGLEIVSASGDRNIKVWDWPSRTCTRTIVGHTKGIACVQYDGRRIVSGSSDNEIKVFDQQTGVEVASLRGHSDLVRTVQAGFGDLPNSVEDDLEEARRVDAEYFKAVEEGRVGESSRTRRPPGAPSGNSRGGRPGNAGSKRPEDITAFGAKLPPGGGGGKYGRIVSGSYDTSIIIWRRDKEGIWKGQHHLKQEEAQTQALARDGELRPRRAGGQIPLHPSMRGGLRAPAARHAADGAGSSLSTAAMAGTSLAPPSAEGTTSRTVSAPPASGGPTHRPNTPGQGTASSSNAANLDSPVLGNLSTQSVQSYRQMIDIAVPNGATALAQALASYPVILSQRSYLTAAIDREPNPLVRSQLRQTVSAAMIRTQFEQARQRREAIRNAEQNQHVSTSTSTAEASPSTQTRSQPAPAAAPALTAAQQAAVQAAAAHQARAQFAPHPGVHLHQVPESFAFASSAPAPAPPQSRSPSPSPPLPSTITTTHENIPSSDTPTPLPRPMFTTTNGVRSFTQPPANPARIFKLQFDARRIVCCSQTSVIVGWDFCNDDAELEEAARFFAAVS